MAASEAENKQFRPDLVVIKSEPEECNVNIKIEPEFDEYEGSGNFENVNACAKVENETHVENIVVKIEPTFYSSEEELNLASYQNRPPQPQTVRPILKIPQLKKKKKLKDVDEDYVPKKKKKKVKEIVKKTYTTKAKKKDNMYADNVTEQIELINITEEERLIEHKDLWQSRKHMRYTCYDCALGFVMEEPYTMHMKSHAPETGDFECDICRCRNRSEEHLYKHRLRHYRRYRCAICKRVHKDKETAASHVMSEHVRETFACDQCGRGFKRPAYLKKHIKQQHTTGQRHDCPVCARVFFDSGMFKTHFRRHNEEVRNPVKQVFICDTCCHQSKSKGALKRHLLVHGGDKNLACGLCPAKYRSRRGLKLHQMNKHMDRKERQREPCPHCERECTTPALLRQHIRRMHTDRTKKYQCDHCKRFYYTKGEVRAHIAWSHARAPARRALVCCGREFRTRTRLKDHVELHHLKLEKQRVYKCDQCEKAFANKQVLNRHKKSHTDLTYPCPECGARFKCGAYVKVHHQIKHLNMTRAQIKALKEAKRALRQQNERLIPNAPGFNANLIANLNSDKAGFSVNLNSEKEGFRVNLNSEKEGFSVNMNSEREMCFEKVVVKQEVVCDSDGEISVPKFDFVDLKSELRC